MTQLLVKLRVTSVAVVALVHITLSILNRKPLSQLCSGCPLWSLEEAQGYLSRSITRVFLGETAVEDVDASELVDFVDTMRIAHRD